MRRVLQNFMDWLDEEISDEEKVSKLWNENIQLKSSILQYRNKVIYRSESMH
jgi:hypothetical protein